MDGNLNIVQTNAATFNDSLSNDFIIYTATSNQNILIGTNTVDTSAINIKNSNIVFNRTINTSCNVNIGNVVNPSSLLHISSNSKSYITFTNSSNNNGILMGIDNNSAGGFIFNTSNDYLRFGTSNVERMRITNTGLFGIGMSNPLYNLDMVGSQRISTNSNGVQLYLQNSNLTSNTSGQNLLFNIGKTQVMNNTGNIKYTHQNDISLSNSLSLGFHSNEDVLSLYGNRYVGINTSSLSNALEVNGDIFVYKYGSNIYPPSAMSSSNQTIGNITYTISSFSTVATNFQAFDSNTTTVWEATNGGYTNGTGLWNNTLTINTTIDGTVYAGQWIQLQLSQMVLINQFTLYPKTGNTFSPNTTYLAGSIDGSNWNMVYSNSVLPITDAIYNIYQFNNSRYFNYYRFVFNSTKSSGNVAVGDISLRYITNSPNIITSNNNIGIGLSNPSYTLDVVGTGRYTNLLFFNNQLSNCVISLSNPNATPASTNTGYMGFGISNSALRYHINSSNDNHVFFQSNTELMRLTGTGRLGIGTSNPQFTLDVNGTMNVAGAITTTGSNTLTNLLVTGTSTLCNNLSAISSVSINSNLTIIGTTSTSNLLFFNNQLSNCVISFSNPNATPSSTNTGYMGFGISNSALRYHINTTIDNHVFFQSNTELMRLTGTGRLGIGTNNPLFNLDVNGTMNVSGASTLSNNTLVYGTTTLSNTLLVTGISSLSNALNVSGVSTLSNNTIIYGTTTLSNTLTVSGISTLSNNLNVSGSLTLSNTLNVSGASTLSNNTLVYGTTTLSNNLNVSGPLTLSNTLNVSGASTLSNTTLVYGTTTLSNTLTVSGVSTLSNSLNVSGVTTKGNLLHMNNQLSNCVISLSNPNATPASTNTGYMGFGISNSALRYHINTTTDNHIFFQSNTELMRLTGTGFLGIGNNNPSYPLDVSGSVRITSILNFNSQINNCMLALFSATSPPTSGLTNYYGFGVNGGVLRYQVDGSGSSHVFYQSNTELARITGGGRLGIGISNPSYPLDVVGDINFTGTFRQNGTAYIGSQWSNSGANAFLIGSNVGLGISNPSYTLDVTGNERISGVLHMANQVGSNCMISLYSATQPPTAGTTTYFGFGVSNSALRYQVAAIGDNHVFFYSNTELARITGTGRLGIGTNNPGYALDVTGDINFTGTFRQNGTAYIGSQWSNSGANVFLIGSNVGLGLSNPGFTLDVNGSINASNSFTALPTTFTQCNVLPTTFGLSNTLLFNSLTYTASASGSPLSPAYFAFRTNDAGWISQTLYSGSNYGGSTTTTISGSNYLGEWLQLQLPSSVTITQYLIRPNGNGTFTTNAPSKFVIGGSTDGSTWTLLDIRSNQSWPTATAITYSNLSINTPYSYYRIVSLNTFNAAAGIGTSIGTLTYFYNFASSAYSMNISGGNLYAMSNIYCSNNIGIRTNNPLYSLDVFSGASLLRNGNQLGSFTSNQLLLGYGNTNTYMHAINSRHNSAGITGNSVDFLLWNTGLLSSTIGNCNSMSITPIGVGIFNPTPLYNLDINGTTLLRNGNTATVFTNNQILLGYGTSNTYMHAINSRHNQTTGNTNSIDFLIWTSNVSSTTVGNCNSMSITATGVGIFNSNPAYELDVAGSCRVTSNLIVNGSNLSLSFGASATTPTVFALNSTGTGNTTSVLQFVNSGHYITCTDSNSYDSLSKPAFGHNIYYKSGGHIFSGQAYFASQVGIGFSNAQCLLDVKQPSITGGYNGIIKISQANTSTSNYFPGIFIANDDTPTLNRYKNAILSQGDGSFGLANLAFCTNNTINQVQTSFADCRLLISSNGNVGIGTTTPSYPLDVSGSARISTILHMNNQIANCILSLFSITQPPTSGLTNYYGFGINNGVLRYQVDGSNSSHVFFQSNTELARITGSGRIGVGNTNPSFEVDVTGIIRASTLLTSGNGASGTGTYLVMTNTNVNLGSGAGMLFGVGLSNNGSTNVTSANTAYLSMLFVNSSGSYIALGQGAGYASNLFSVNFDTGNATLKGSLTQNSDRNLKSNLSLITDPMNIINNINGYSYYKVRHNDGRKYIGLIAQEVQKVLPEVVHKNIDDNYLSVAYGDMAAVFVEAIKELNNKVSKLERENKELKDDLTKIKEHLGLYF